MEPVITGRRVQSLEERLFAPAARPELASASLEEEVTCLFDQLRNPLARYLQSFRLPLPDCDEIIQEVFLALFLHLRKGKSRENIRGWVFRVAHNLGLKRCAVNNKDRRLIRASVGDIADIKSGPELDPEQQVTALQRRRRLIAVVHALPEQYRRCLYLRAEGLRYREIANVLGISLGAVAQALQRSLTRLVEADRR